MTDKVCSTRLFRVEPEVIIGSLEFYCQTTWYKPNIFTDPENLFPDDVICEVKLTDCINYWEAKVIASQIMGNTTFNASNDFNNKRLRVIQGLLSGQREVDNRPCRLSVNSQHELLFTVEGRADSSKYEEHLVAVVDIWKLQLHPVRSQSLSIVWGELLNNVIEQTNFAERLNAESMKTLQEKVECSTKRIDALNRATAKLEKKLIAKFSVVLNSKKKKIKELQKLLEIQE
ncbi:60_t:CDS:2 [Paraglomus brasilianum]|uniref:60_t:CDS:1 n=1 Tax=Paraglomus brasilianum TaxID=144538 RepID=A0A9N9BD17_9GLOM|nr:60_t:CDS:2 [Paraglomus brasilianum]